MITSLNLAMGTWATIDECRPLHCTVQGSDLASIIVGDEDKSSVELIVNTAGLRRLIDAGNRAMADMDALFEQENAAREVDGPVVSATRDGAIS